MSIFVACNLPAGLIIDYNGETFRLNGPHVGADLENLPRNGYMPDNEIRASGYGLTTLEGKHADAFKAWAESVTKSPEGKPLQTPYAPIASGALKWSESAAETRKEATKGNGMALAGLDPDKDLPNEVETADETKKVIAKAKD